MANLTKPSDVKVKNDSDEILMQLAASKVYRGAAVTLIPGTGYAKALATTLLALIGGVNFGTERFIGVATQNVDNSGGSAGDKTVVVKRRGVFLFDSTGLAVADIGKRMYFSDDHTVTKTIPAAGTGAIYAGKLESVDSEGAWVRIDDAVINGLRKVTAVKQLAGVAGATVYAKLYQVPPGAKAYLMSAKYSYTAKPNFATSCALFLRKLSATVRTTLLSAASVDVNNTGVAVDTPTALTLSATPADLEMIAGDQVEISEAAVGALTAAGDTHVHAEILEVGGDN